MNSSSFWWAWRNADAERGLMRVMLTPNWVRPAASAGRCFSRPEITAANSFGYDAIGCAGILAISIFGMMPRSHLIPRRQCQAPPSKDAAPDSSHSFDDGRGAHTGADAERDQGGRQIAALQFVDHGAENHRPGGAERMAKRDRAAV